MITFSHHDWANRWKVMQKLQTGKSSSHALKIKALRCLDKSHWFVKQWQTYKLMKSCFVRWNLSLSLLLFYPLAFPDFLTGRITLCPFPSSFPCQSWRIVYDLKYSSFPSSSHLDALDSPEACHALWLNFALHVSSSMHLPVKKTPLVMPSSMNAAQMKKFMLW